MAAVAVKAYSNAAVDMAVLDVKRRIDNLWVGIRLPRF
jgi:hypothetical protein